MRRPLRQLSDPGALERAVHHDVLSVPGRVEQRTGQLFSRVPGSFGEICPVTVATGRARRLLVIAELHHHLPPWSDVRPHRDGPIDRLEVQESQPAVERLECPAEPRLHDHLTGPECAALALLDLGEPEALGHMHHPADAPLHQRPLLGLVGAIQGPDVMLIGREAAIPEGAFAFEHPAMGADRDRGFGAGQRSQLFFDYRRIRG
jgi:hypothetical protein